MARFAPGKINLTLRVGARRPDGYHDVASLVAWIDLADQLLATPRGDDALTLTCDTPGVPLDDRNLVLRAARAYLKRSPDVGGFDFELVKRIPAGAGLGGGSSDAAAALLLLNERAATPLPLPVLMEIAATLGSDVPLFLAAPLSIACGRGESIIPLASHWSAWAALLLPSIHSSTPAVYAAFDALAAPPSQSSVAEIVPELGSADAVMSLAFNDLQEAAFAVNPPLRETYERVARRCGAALRMSGSGAAGYRLFDQEAAAQRFAAAARDACEARVEVVRVGAAAAIPRDA